MVLISTSDDNKTVLKNPFVMEFPRDKYKHADLYKLIYIDKKNTYQQLWKALDCGVSQKTLRVWINKLKEMGIIEIHMGRDARNKIFVITDKGKELYQSHKQDLKTRDVIQNEALIQKPQND